MGTCFKQYTYSKHAYIEEITDSPSCIEFKDSKKQTAPGLFSKTSTAKNNAPNIDLSTLRNNLNVLIPECVHLLLGLTGKTVVYQNQPFEPFLEG